MRQRLLKSLRIAVTAVSLLVCGLLIVLWVRSYYYADHLSYRVSSSRLLDLFAKSGFLEIALFPNTKSQDGYERIEAEKIEYQPFWRCEGIGPFSPFVSAPYWLFLTIFATFAALPWIKWRFSLRTLLIVLTLFALFFGAIAMSM